MADWVSEVEDVIEGPLSLDLTAIAPMSAINFHKSGRGITLLEWTGSISQFTNLAIYRIGLADQECCLEIITIHIDKMAQAVCKICLEPRDLLRFFRLIHALSPELFKILVEKIDLSSPDAEQSLKQILNRNDLLASYLKLARLATWTGGEIGKLGSQFINEVNDRT